MNRRKQGDRGDQVYPLSSLICLSARDQFHPLSSQGSGVNGEWGSSVSIKHYRETPVLLSV